MSEKPLSEVGFVDQRLGAPKSKWRNRAVVGAAFLGGAATCLVGNGREAVERAPSRPVNAPAQTADDRRAARSSRVRISPHQAKEFVGECKQETGLLLGGLAVTEQNTHLIGVYDEALEEYCREQIGLLKEPHSKSQRDKLIGIIEHIHRIEDEAFGPAPEEGMPQAPPEYDPRTF